MIIFNFLNDKKSRRFCYVPIYETKFENLI